MIISCLGDSLTEGDYGIKGVSCMANVHKEGYPYFLARLMDCEVRNFGKCGYRSSDLLKFYDEGNINVSGSDIVLIMLGTNGGQSASEDTPDNICYRELILRVKRDAPKAKIYLITAPHVTSNPAYSNCGYAQQVKEAVEFTRKTALETGLALIDLASDPRLTEGMEPYFQSNDGLHFNALGYQKIAERIWFELTK